MDFSYRGQQVFAAFNFSSTSKVVGLSGPPGCGKTTLLKLLAGQLRPTRAIKLDVPESPVIILQEDALLPWLTGWQNLELTGSQSPSVKSHPLFGVVEHLLTKRAHAMSFGQRRTVELFRAFVFNPALLCLDEPFNFIDSATRIQFLNYINVRAFPGQLIMSTHHVDELATVQAEAFRFSGRLPVNALERCPNE